MGTIELEQWNDFFVAVAGAAAALAGLMIVAISVNVERIIKYPQLPPRAGAAVGSLVLALLASVAGLADQPITAYGIELLVLGACGWYLHLGSARASFANGREQGRSRRESVNLVITGQLQSLPFVAAGVLLLAGTSAGVLVLFAGVLCVFVFSMIDAWVLLIEILR